jgi:hypothetical protein
MQTTEQKPKRNAKGQFVKGQSGCPTGRPRGIADLRKTARGLLESRQEQLVQVLIDKAVSGDPAALKLALERVYTAPRQAHEAVEIEGLAEAKTYAEQAHAVRQALAKGQIAPDVAGTILTGIKDAAVAERIEALTDEIEGLKAQLLSA